MLWQVLAALAILEHGQGNVAKARELCLQSRQIINTIANDSGSDKIRRSFLELRVVQSMLQWPDDPHGG